MASCSAVEINGSYQENTALFKGTARFKCADIQTDTLFFHLPPNRYIDLDEREQFELRIATDQFKTVSRSDLMFLEPPSLKNIHLPQGIKVSAVTVNNTVVPLKIIDNPKLAPLNNSQQALLAVAVGNVTARQPVLIEISFQTRFNKLPNGYFRLLWDFIPRPAGFYQKLWDYKDVLAPMLRQRAQIDVINSSGALTRTLTSQYDSPFPYLLLDRWRFTADHLKLAYDSFFDDTASDLLNRIDRVLLFLERNQLLKDDDRELRLILWDGPLQVSGLTVFLPRQLFRYPDIFFKQFEIIILNGIVEALLKKAYLVDTNENAWILPAVQAEVLRRFFQDRFRGNTYIFPWLNWINPEFFSDHSNKRWIDNKHSKEVVAADSPQDIAYYSHIYHPGGEKGFHLFWMLNDGQPDYREHLLRRIAAFLREDIKEQKPLSKHDFLDFFTSTRVSREAAETWLSTSGHVDYAITQVEVSVHQDRYLVQVEIENMGTQSPVLEISFGFDNGSTERRQINTGAGRYTFLLKDRPIQIVLDPSFNILDDDLLNNTWRFPLRTRLIWDFPSVDNWLLTFSPLFGDGNTFDQNIIGLNLTYSYLTQSAVQLNIWKGSADDLLWTGELYTTGFPFQGTKLYLAAGYVGAINSLAFGVRQEPVRYYPELWIDFSIWKETLDALEDSHFNENQQDWYGARFSTGFPVHKGAVSLWQLTLSGLAGKSMFQPQSEYQQFKLKQFFRYVFDDSDIHLRYDHGRSAGTVPLQKLYPMGGTDGLSGFPRTTDLLFYENRIFEIGVTLPGFLKHSNINLIKLMWLHQVVPTLNFHLGQGITEEGVAEVFTDAEISLNIIGEFANRFESAGRIAIAQPIGHKKYKDYRIILFSDWIF
ncbi:hypothetical protein KKI24_22220 [bacterium]|nr:hypothetical protein [bacterium]